MSSLRLAVALHEIEMKSKSAYRMIYHWTEVYFLQHILLKSISFHARKFIKNSNVIYPISNVAE